jgi:hypothetical protein
LSLVFLTEVVVFDAVEDRVSRIQQLAPYTLAFFVGIQRVVAFRICIVSQSCPASAEACGSS